MSLRAKVVSLVSPIVWIVPGHDAKKLFKFSLTEHGSVLDLSAAARQTPSIRRRAKYIQHLLDEKRHTQIFSRRSAQLRQSAGKAPYGEPRADIEDLFENLGEVRFLAFVHRGERRGCEQFEVYSDLFRRWGDDKTHKLFSAILEDERRHKQYTWDLLVEMTGGEREARAQLQKAAAWEAWRTWRRAGRLLAHQLFFVLTTAVYVLLAPYAVATRFIYPEKKGWVAPAQDEPMYSARNP